MRKLFVAMLGIMLLFGMSSSAYAFSDTTKGKLKGTIVLYLNESKAYVDGLETKIDSNNKKIYPVLLNKNTMLPLKFTAESLKAKVKWDAKTNTATLTLKGKTIKVKTGSRVMYVNGKEKKISIPAKTIEGRLFVPLRAISEAFDKKIFWDKRGLIIISNKEKPLSSKEEILEIIEEYSTNSQTTPIDNLEKETKTMINIQTDKGNIQIAVYPELMPITTENFLGLVDKGFYNNLTFHRVEDWVVQGGDPDGNGTGGSGKTIKLETNPKLKNIRGAVAMARSMDPDSASSQFYILKTDASWLDGQYAVFGNVVSGMDVVDSMTIGDKMIKVEKVVNE